MASSAPWLEIRRIGTERLPGVLYKTRLSGRKLERGGLELQGKNEPSWTQMREVMHSGAALTVRMLYQ